MKATLRQLDNGTWQYKLGPFTSKVYNRKQDCEAQAKRHEQRGLSRQFWQKHHEARRWEEQQLNEQLSAILNNELTK